MTGKRVRIAALSTTLHWEHRHITSNDSFDLATAKNYMEHHVALSLRFMEEAAALDADLVVGPEYFEGSEMFTTTDDNKREFVDSVETSATIDKMRSLSKRRGVYLACSFNLYHGNTLAQTGVMTHPDGDTVNIQIKNTCLPHSRDMEHTYDLFETDIGKTGIFTCSDFNTYPEDPIALAKRGMQIVVVPGAGFGLWQYLITKPADLGCVLAHSDGGRAMIVTHEGKVAASTFTPNSWVCADLTIEPKEPTDRLRWGVN